jgi:UDP-2,3-diacylglucosamine pyrophosphatase LpxH
MAQYHSVFISDVHLGTKGSKAELLVAFLREVECHNLFLVGDIFDGWRLKKNWYWNEHHSTVVQKVLRMARKGTKVYYIPGNHDEFMREFLEYNFGSIELHNEMTYTALNSKKYIVIHGDKFDFVTLNMKWLAHIGDQGYTLLLNLNTMLHWVMSKLRLPYWSLSKWAKSQVKQAVNFVGNYEASLVNYARIKHADGIICGHIHSANISTINHIEYMNSGDWVESCTALVEHTDGRWEIITWTANEDNTNNRHMDPQH